MTILCHHGHPAVGCRPCQVERREDFTRLFLCSPSHPGPPPRPVGEGSMRGADGHWLGLDGTEVRARIVGPLADVEVRQRFRNSTSGALDATYMFPLPGDASVYRMEFRMGERIVCALLKEKEEARDRYRQARRGGRAAALLEQERPDLFSLSVAGIPAGGVVEVKLAYHDTLAYREGDWQFVFPMLAAVRPAEVCLEVEVRAGRDVGTPHSASHGIEATALETAGAWRVVLQDGPPLPNRDFVLAWRGVRPGIRPEVWFERKPGQAGTFLLLVTPGEKPPEAPSASPSRQNHCANCGGPLEDSASLREIPGMGVVWPCAWCGALVAAGGGVPPTAPRDVVVLLDRSQSMQAAGLSRALAALEAVFEALNGPDEMRLLAFNHRVEEADHDWLPLNDQTRAHMREFLEGLAPGGGTDLESALRRAAQLPRRSGRARLAILLTDGAVGDPAGLLRELPDILEQMRLYILGLGPALKRTLVENLARRGGGMSEIEADGEEARARFLSRLREVGPVLTDLCLDWDQAGPAEVYPHPLPDLFSGQPLCVWGRFSGCGRSRLLLKARYPGGLPFRQEIDVDLPEASDDLPGLERLWARHRIESLCERLHQSTERLSGVRSEVLPLALAHKLVSPFTTLVAEDSQVSFRPGRVETLPPPSQLLEISDRRRISGPNPLGLLPLAAAVGLAWLAGADGWGQAGIGLLIMLSWLLPVRRAWLLLLLLLAAEALRAHFIPLPAGMEDLLLLGLGGLLLAFLSWLAKEPKVRYRSLRHTPYLEQELEWVRRHPTREIDLLFLMDDAPDAAPHLDDMQAGVDELILALKDLPLGQGLRVGQARYPGPAAQPGAGLPTSLQDLSELLSVPWRPQAERVAVWLGNAPKDRCSAWAESCREVGIQVHTVPVSPSREQTRSVFPEVARITAGACLPLSEMWLLLPLIAGACRRDGDMQRLEEHIRESLECETEKQIWEQEIQRRKSEGFERLWVVEQVSSENTARVSPKGGWKSDSFRLEIVTQHEPPFQVACVVDKAERMSFLDISLPASEMEKRGLRAGDTVLVRLV